MDKLKSMLRGAKSPNPSNSGPPAASERPPPFDPAQSSTSPASQNALDQETESEVTENGKRLESFHSAIENEKEIEGLAAPVPGNAAAVGGVAEEAAVGDKADKSNEAAEAPDTKEVGDGSHDEESKYPKALPLALLTFGLALATFVVALDNTIIGRQSS